MSNCNAQPKKCWKDNGGKYEKRGNIERNIAFGRKKLNPNSV